MAEDHASDAQRRALEALARSHCDYCRYPASIASRGLSVDHIIPRSQGGTFDLANLALACDGCNNHKYNKTVGRDPKTGRDVPLFHPRQDRWGRHFRWSRDRLRIEGRTATGRATLELLRLNRATLVNVRRLLLLAGEHPPPEPSPE